MTFLQTDRGLFALSNLLIASAIAVIALAYYVTPISRTVSFWAAFVLARPFGATMGDLLTKTSKQGGLGFGTIGSSAVLMSILVALIYWSMRNDRQKVMASHILRERS